MANKKEVEDRDAWEDITDVLTPEGIERLNVGEVLMFDFEGSRTDLKIREISDGTVLAERITTYSPEEVDRMVAMAEQQAARMRKRERKIKRRSKYGSED